MCNCDSHFITIWVVLRIRNGFIGIIVPRIGDIIERFYRFLRWWQIVAWWPRRYIPSYRATTLNILHIKYVSFGSLPLQWHCNGGHWPTVKKVIWEKNSVPRLHRFFVDELSVAIMMINVHISYLPQCLYIPQPTNIQLKRKANYLLIWTHKLCGLSFN